MIVALYIMLAQSYMVLPPIRSKSEVQTLAWDVAQGRDAAARQPAARRTSRRSSIRTVWSSELRVRLSILKDISRLQRGESTNIIQMNAMS